MKMLIGLLGLFFAFRVHSTVQEPFQGSIGSIRSDNQSSTPIANLEAQNATAVPGKNPEASIHWNLSEKNETLIRNDSLMSSKALFKRENTRVTPKDSNSATVDDAGQFSQTTLQPPGTERMMGDVANYRDKKMHPNVSVNTTNLGYKLLKSMTSTLESIGTTWKTRLADPSVPGAQGQSGDEKNPIISSPSSSKSPSYSSKPQEISVRFLDTEDHLDAEDLICKRLKTLSKTIRRSLTRKISRVVERALQAGEEGNDDDDEDDEEDYDDEDEDENCGCGCRRHKYCGCRKRRVKKRPDLTMTTSGRRSANNKLLFPMESLEANSSVPSPDVIKTLPTSTTQLITTTAPSISTTESTTTTSPTTAPSISTIESKTTTTSTTIQPSTTTERTTTTPVMTTTPEIMTTTTTEKTTTPITTTKSTTELTTTTTRSTTKKKSKRKKCTKKRRKHDKELITLNKTERTH